MFRGLQTPTRFSGGGGSSRNCRSSPEADAVQWGGGGVVAEIFGRLRKPSRLSGGGGSSRILA